MKKIFTFLLAAGSITFASAQSKNDWSHDKGNSGNIVYSQPMPRDIYKGTTVTTNPFDHAKDKDAQIREINREFDKKIQAVNSNRFLRSRQKKDQIRLLEKQRQEQIQQVEMRFSGRDKRDNNHKW